MNTKDLELVLLATGESLKIKSDELLATGAIIAQMWAIEAWVKDNPKVQDISPIVIADPTAQARTYLHGAIVQVPAYAITEPGKHFPGGWIDLNVPMWPKERGGQLAVLVIRNR